MPRWSQVIYDENGKPAGIACGHSRHKRCSTPGCHGHAALECDHPVERRGTPKVGDTKVHRESGKLFYLRQIIDGRTLKVSTRPNGGVLQVISVDDWVNKADATCDRPVCNRCVVVVDGKDWCPVHARAAGL